MTNLQYVANYSTLIFPISDQHFPNNEKYYSELTDDEKDFVNKIIEILNARQAWLEYVIREPIEIDDYFKSHCKFRYCEDDGLIFIDNDDERKYSHCFEFSWLKWESGSDEWYHFVDTDHIHTSNNHKTITFDVMNRDLFQYLGTFQVNLT